MCDNNDNSEYSSSTSHLYGSREFTYSVIHHPGLSQEAQGFPITRVLPETGGEYIPTFSHYHEPDEQSRFKRLLELHRIMVIVLLSLDKLSIYEKVLALHDRKGTLILVIDNWTDPGDVDLLVHAACHGWSALNEVVIAVAYRHAGDRPRVPASKMPPPRKPMAKAPPLKSQFVDDKVLPHGLWWVNGVGFVECRLPMTGR